MPQTIKEFLNRKDIKDIQEHKQGQIMEQDFFRDPLRTITFNPDLFYAPADGIVLYAKEIEPDEPFEIKGAEFTLKDMLADEDYKGRALVCGIFMTALDVHINRVPASCYYLDRRNTPPLQTHGISMIMAENDLLEDLTYAKKDLEYLRYNEKHVSMFHCPAISGRFYLVQIADRDIDVILNWRKGQPLTQGDRFGQIRYGSQCDLVIPLKKQMELEILVKPLDHVEAGIDPIIRIN